MGAFHHVNVRSSLYILAFIIKFRFVFIPGKNTINNTPVGLYAGIVTTTVLTIMLAIALVSVIICSRRQRRVRAPEVLSYGHQPKADEPIYEEIMTVSTEGELHFKLDENDAYSASIVTLPAFGLVRDKEV